MTNGPLEIGFTEPGFGNAPGTVTINPGATVNVAQDIDLDTNGLLKLQGGTLTAARIVSLDLLSGQFEGDFEWTSGTLHVGIVGGSVTNQGGTLAPGQSAGRTTIDGNYTQQAAATLEIEIGGTMAETQHDFVSVEGAATLDGELQLALIDGFRAHRPADVHRFRYARRHHGRFQQRRQRPAADHGRRPGLVPGPLRPAKRVRSKPDHSTDFALKTV